MKIVPRRNNFGLNLFDDSIFDSFFENSFFKANNTQRFMETDLQEKDGNYILDIDLPGFAKEDIKIELNNGYLVVSAEKNEKGNYIYQERYSGRCARSFYVGDSIKEEDIKASYKDGILKLTISKLEKTRSQQKRYISID